MLFRSAETWDPHWADPMAACSAETMAETKAGQMAVQWDPMMAAATADGSVEKMEARTAETWDPHWADPMAACSAETMAVLTARRMVGLRVCLMAASRVVMMAD